MPTQLKIYSPQVKALVCEHFEIEPETLEGRNGTNHVSRARQCFIYAMYLLLGRDFRIPNEVNQTRCMLYRALEVVEYNSHHDVKRIGEEIAKKIEPAN